MSSTSKPAVTVPPNAITGRSTDPVTLQLVGSQAGLDKILGISSRFEDLGIGKHLNGIIGAQLRAQAVANFALAGIEPALAKHVAAVAGLDRFTHMGALAAASKALSPTTTALGKTFGAGLLQGTVLSKFAANDSVLSAVERLQADMLRTIEIVGPPVDHETADTVRLPAPTAGVGVAGKSLDLDTLRRNLEPLTVGLSSLTLVQLFGALVTTCLLVSQTDDEDLVRALAVAVCVIAVLIGVKGSKPRSD